MSSRENCSDRDGNPFGFANSRTRTYTNKTKYPRKCKYCRETVTGKRDEHTHMVTAHKG